ncbi:transmembrane protein 267 [Tribolium castaneum]|uniref:transmembrane protein 267 n=1 Tax=Tribolium castaneum TaxID=7070 RepID=UPI0030FE485C
MTVTANFVVINYITILLALVSITGDYIVSHTKLHLFQALFDNATHATIGALSWLYICINCKNRSHTQTLIEIGLCAGIASLIDIDHFISARSVHLKVCGDFSFVSHHTRDATRRGFWFYPFGSTPPIPYFLYVGMTCFLPPVVCVLHDLVWIGGESGPRYTFISKGAVI